MRLMLYIPVTTFPTVCYTVSRSTPPPLPCFEEPGGLHICVCVRYSSFPFPLGFVSAPSRAVGLPYHFGISSFPFDTPYLDLKERKGVLPL